MITNPIVCSRCKGQTSLHLSPNSSKACSWCGHSLVFELAIEHIDIRRGVHVNFSVKDCCVEVAVNGIISDFLYEEDRLKSIQVGGVWVTHPYGDVRQWIHAGIVESTIPVATT